MRKIISRSMRLAKKTVACTSIIIAFYLKLPSDLIDKGLTRYTLSMIRGITPAE